LLNVDWLQGHQVMMLAGCCALAIYWKIGF
jgi:hypothetical protein